MYTKKTASKQVSKSDKRQLKVKIKTIISGFDQPLPAELDRYWSVLQLFTKWILNKVKSEQFDKPLYLGGSHKENYAMW